MMSSAVTECTLCPRAHSSMNRGRLGDCKRLRRPSPLDANDAERNLCFQKIDIVFATRPQSTLEPSCLGLNSSCVVWEFQFTRGHLAPWFNLGQRQQSQDHAQDLFQV